MREYNKAMQKKLALLMVFLSSTTTLLFAGEDGNHFSLGKQYARSNQAEFAYMEFRKIIQSAPDSSYRESALFATGEYFATLADFQETEAIFKQFCEEFPASKLKIFALAYLYKVATINNDTSARENFRTEIITFQQVGLIFKNSKQFKYLSPFHHQYRAIIEINKITVDKEGEILAEISY